MPTTTAPRLLVIALIAGTLDISDNLIYNATRAISPVQVFHYIAAGLIGARASLAGGAATVALGVAMHYAIALMWTIVFFALSRHWRWLTRRPWIAGPLYGAAVYLFMNLVAVPHSRVPHLAVSITLANRVNGVLALLFCVGATVAVLTRRWLPPAV